MSEGAAGSIEAVAPTGPGKRVLEALSLTAPLYAILDGARDSRIFPWVVGTRSPYRCLYRGKLEDDLAFAAPYLLRLGRGHAFTDEFFNSGWNNSWGVLFASETPSKELHRHLRRFLQVKTEDGRRLVFRYYDPRVLRVFLPTCTPAELETLFGPIDAFACESLDKTRFQLFRRSAKGLDQQLLTTI